MNHDDIVKQTASRCSMDILTTEFVIRDSFKNMSRVLSNTDVSEVEVAGLGKFKLSENKLRRRLDKYYSIRQAYEEKQLSYLSNRETMTDQEYRKLEKKVRQVNSDISNLERKYLRLNKTKDQN